MIVINYSTSYLRERRRFLKNNAHLVEQTIKAIAIFTKNPRHPSLNLEKLKGGHVWTIRIDRENRIFFVRPHKQTVLFINIGKHDKYRKY